MSLICKNVAKSFSQGGPKGFGPSKEIIILNQLNLHVSEGESVAILGESGSGKSTLLSLLARLDTASSGEILLDGIALGQLSERELVNFRAQKIGIVFQQYHLLSHLTALENVSLPLEISGCGGFDEARKALDEVGLAHRMHHFPHEMSGGECQRVAIARALVIRPRILLADEPSGNLDLDTGLKVMGILFERIREHKMTTVLVTHNRDLAKLCDRQLMLREGQLFHLNGTHH